MPPDRPTSNPDQPVADDPLAGLRKLAGLAKELGVHDVSAFTEALEAARADGRGAEMFRSLKATVDQFAGQPSNARSLSELGARLKDLVAGRADNVADLQRRVELALLHRVEELSSSASTAGLVDLATAYAQIRLAGAGQSGESRQPS